jgi:hypothetical protein
MMNKILGLPVGACASAGTVIAGKLSAAKATLETSILLKFLLIFMATAPNFGGVMSEWIHFRSLADGCRKQVSIADAIAGGTPSYRRQRS